MPRKQAPYYKNRLLLPTKLSYVKKWINEMLDKGFIRELTLLATIPFLLTIKPSSGVRICYNYSGLNTVTIKNWYPLLLIREILNALYSAKYFTKLDIITAFNRIRIAKGYKWLIAFIVTEPCSKYYSGFVIGLGVQVMRKVNNVIITSKVVA